MAKAKKKLLPKDFGALLKQGDLVALKAVFDTCDVNARGGYLKETALAFDDCPDALARWLIEHGADLHAEDRYGETPLHARARHWQGRIESLIELGANVNHGENARGTPLHAAAGSGNIDATRLLLQHGARADALNREGQTPLAYALQRCSNAQIAAIAEIAGQLLEARNRRDPKPVSFFARVLGRGRTEDAAISPDLKAAVTRIGIEFEFHRSGFNPEYLEETSAGLDKLYALFDVPPVPRRAMHDGQSPIAAKATRWEDRFEELWEQLVPSKGAADTVQGEVVRIAGRIHGELERNGGVNWDGDFRKMADDFLMHIGSGVPIPETALIAARANIAAVKKRGGDSQRLCELAVDWVSLNPKPAKLPPPGYTR